MPEPHRAPPAVHEEWPYVWTKTAGEILERVATYLHRTPGSEEGLFLRLGYEMVVRVIESWAFSEASEAMPPEAVLERLRGRIAGGQLETWLTSSSGRSLAIVTNTERAMVILLDREGDPGKHAVDPGADGWSTGFVLANGQHDDYPNEDTVPLEEAFRILGRIITEGSPPFDAAWSVDR